MAVVKYTVLRALAAGAQASDTRIYDLPVRYAGLIKERKILSNSRRMLSGLRETYYQSADNSWSVTTIPLNPSKRAELVMFLESVEQGEQFLFSPYSYARLGNSVPYVNAILASFGYQEPLDAMKDDMVSYSLSIVQVP